MGKSKSSKEVFSYASAHEKTCLHFGTHFTNGHFWGVENKYRMTPYVDVTSYFICFTLR